MRTPQSNFSEKEMKIPWKWLLSGIISTAIFASLISCCASRQCQKTPATLSQRLLANRLETGAVPSTLQWKKAAVFAIASPQQETFLQWLQEIPGDLETVSLKTWDPDHQRPLSLFMLFGWSTSGADELRRVTLDSAVVKGSQVDVYVSRPHIISAAPGMGTADMRFVGWEIPLKDLAPGTYVANLYLRRDTITMPQEPGTEKQVETIGYQNAGELNFAVLQADK